MDDPAAKITVANITEPSATALPRAFTIEDIRPEHASELATLHERCFPGYFLTLMGSAFLKKFYGEFARHGFDFGCVARDPQSRQLVGLVTGTSDATAHFRSFYRRNWAFLGWVVVSRFVASSAARRAIVARSSHLTRAIGLITGRGSQVTGRGPAEQCPVRLLSIATDPQWRGAPLSAAIDQHFQELLRAAGHRRCGLSTQTTNERGIAFFQKHGWQITFRSEAGVWFEKDL